MKLWIPAVMFVAASSLALVAQTGTPSDAPRVLRVTSAGDDGAAGTLRWAIDTSNATPRRETIELAATDPITPKSALPAIKGPVEIVGAAWSRTGTYSVIDGSGYVPGGGPEACPGAAAGQF